MTLPTLNQIQNWIQWYRKPSYQDIREFSAAVRDGKRESTLRRGSIEVPSRLGLDQLLQNWTCSPMSLSDFYRYLKHVEHSPENLEFYMWFIQYQATYVACPDEALPTIPSSVLSDRGSQVSKNTTSSHHTLTENECKFTESHSNVFDLDIECDVALGSGSDDITAKIAAFIDQTSKCSSKSEKSRSLMKTFMGSCSFGVCRNSKSPRSALTRADLPKVVDLFLMPGSEKELNIPPGMRNAVLLALEHDDGPARFRPIAEHCYQLLKNCSHRNFVRIGVSNGTFETVCAATTFGALLTLAGYILVLMRAYYPHQNAHARWEVLFSWPMWWFGMGLLLSGLRGSCFFMLLLSRRNHLPWEKQVTKQQQQASSSADSNMSSLINMYKRLSPFENKVRIKDLALRDLQHRIVFQSVVVGTMFATAMTLVFIFLPVWK
ncbi:hypothetical protein VC83_00603 [Pseudogymnoascus destructans]|uniref:RGS domain-containing protein n=2 Tax=Pseudogymnoascus destructans TaxID=655981 RepID=L8GBR0_PSED2|nr:uncharacterized protein VC83_00603 [Pseudogymnoascus destructans]ELR09481.1 hypothetical protein GMDG_00663 [Pseudogymnoascus destructans 20631-21]OAF63058.1 hypothetical protein VC83_00603 [Pseudogymnoascus destructans]